MTKKKSKKLLGTILLVTLIVVSFLSVAIVNNMLMANVNADNYVKSLIKEPTQSVYSDIVGETQDLETGVIIEPYSSENVEVSVSFYSKDDTIESQESSIIKYENTYVPSTGIMYTSDDKFDVIAISDGEVIDVKEDNLLGKVISVKHTDNLVSYYYSIDEISLKVGDKVVQGQIIGKSSSNKISSKDNNLLFEVSYQDKLLNPSEIFDKNVGNYN